MVRYFIALCIYSIHLVCQAQSSDELMLKRINQSDTLRNPEMILKALKTLAEEVEELELSTQANYQYNLGVANGMMYRVDTSAYHFRNALTLATQAGDTLSMVGAWNGLGNLSRINGQNEEALVNFQRALDLVIDQTDTDDLRWQARLYGNIGGIFYDLNEPGSALAYSRKAQQLSRGLNDPDGLSTNLIQMGYSYIELGKFDSALIVNLEATAILEQIADSIGLVYQYQNLGEIYKQTNKIGLARENFKKCIELAARFYEHETHCGSLNALADIELKEGNKAAATTLINRSIALADQHALLTHLRNAFKLSAEIKQRTGDYKSALADLFRYNELQDSIIRMDTKRSMEEFKVKYATLEKEKEIKLANAELANKKRFQQFLIAVIVIIIVFSVVAILLILQRSRLRRSLLSQEIDNLRLQINGIVREDKIIELTEEQINKKLTTPLSDRELEILKQAVTDKTNREIAETLFVSINTVKFHLKNIYEKLGVSNRNDALKIVSDNL